jgi:hypothetical protein
MPKLAQPADTTARRIYSRYVTSMDREERTYLGASVLGAECGRSVWYAFRWAYQAEAPEPRVLRLFDTGHREEDRVLDDLRAGGVYVFGQQQGFSAFGGHLRGHIDGVAGGLPEAPKSPHVIEIKTHGDKSFKDLLANGVRKSKPQHYAQMQVYMHLSGYRRAAYVAVNKNDDSVYVERVEWIQKIADALMVKALSLIKSSSAPSKLHEDPNKPAAYACNWCPAKGVCHDRVMPRANCRTCISSTAITGDNEDARWHCEKHQKFLTLDEQKAGCSDHLYLPSLVPGEQIDADPEKRTITYKMRDGGKEWVDGKAASS